MTTIAVIAGFLFLWALIRWEVKRNIIDILSKLYDKGLISVDPDKLKQESKKKDEN